MRAVGLSLVLLAAVVRTPGPTPASATPGLVVTHVTVIDVEGGRPQPDRTVTVREGRIVSVEMSDAGVPLPPGMEVVDGRGKFLIPGLWDMHVHLSLAKDRGRKALASRRPGPPSPRGRGARRPQLIGV